MVRFTEITFVARKRPAARVNGPAERRVCAFRSPDADHHSARDASEIHVRVCGPVVRSNPEPEQKPARGFASPTTE